jgi:type IV secretory pathway VirB9-like protein
MRCLLAFLAMGILLGQSQVKPVASQRTFNDQVNVVHVAPRYATAIKMPEAVSSVIVGDPMKFLAEHSDKEPMLVLVKPVVEEPVESNLLVTTTKGRQVSFVLRSEGGGRSQWISY